MLTDARQAIAQTFPSGMCEAFATPEACAQQITTALGDFAALRTRAEQLHHEVLGAHTYSHRAQTFIDLMQRYRCRNHTHTRSKEVA